MKINSRTKACIVLPQQPTPCEQFAAEELKKYLHMMTGVNAVISSEPVACASAQFLLGHPVHNSFAAAFVAAEDFDKAVPGNEGFMLCSPNETTLLISGSNDSFERGTVYGVYELLERFCGCSLAAYSKPGLLAGEFVPQVQELILNDIHYVKRSADTAYRTAIVQYGDAAGSVEHGLNLSFLDWLSKNRYNRILTWVSVYEDLKVNGLLQEATRRGIQFTVGHHGAARHFMPPFGNAYFSERYYETHPEYYKLKSDGTRFCISDHMGQCIFCSRNEAIYDVLCEHIVSWAKENPLVDIIAFWPQDGMDEDCQCEACKKHTKLENYTYFMNTLAQRVSAVYPQMKIDMLLYVDLWQCPESIRLSENLLLDEATWHDSGLRTVGKPDGSCLEDSLFEKNIIPWRKTGAQCVYYDYYMGVYPARNRYIPMADEVQSVFRRCRTLGLLGSGTQIECYNLWNHLFNFYCFGRTAYNTDISMEDNLACFSRIFGKGANAVQSIIRLCETCLDGQATIDEAGMYLMKHIDKKRIYALYDEALGAAETALFRNNIRLMRMAFRYSDLETQQEGAEEQYPYQALKEYSNVSEELLYMTEFDSFQHHNPGYGIMIPVAGKSTTYTPDEWYQFE